MNRPLLHYTPPKNWCNDPNGLCYYKGEYHMFYQYFPYGLEWGTMHWGHASSKDLVYYSTHDIALFPSITEDMNGVFSGSAFIENGIMNLFYTGVKYCKVNAQNIHIPEPQNNFLSSQIKITSNDGYHFKPEEKVVVLPIETDLNVAHPVHTRDPKIWKHNKKYYMLLATKYETEKAEQGKLIIYESADLLNFNYFSAYTRENYGNMWECPDFFELNGQQFAIMSPENFVQNKVYPSQATIQKAQLDYENKEFTIAEKYDLLDYGWDLYAPQTFEDENGIRTLIAWLRMPKPQDAENPYIGTFTMPRHIKYENNQISYSVHPNIKNKFNQSLKFSKTGVNLLKANLSIGEYINVSGVNITFDQKLRVDRSSVFPNKDVAISESPKIDADIVELEIYIDESIIEIFINNGRYVITNVLYGNQKSCNTNCREISYYNFNPKKSR